LKYGGIVEAAHKSPAESPYIRRFQLERISSSPNSFVKQETLGRRGYKPSKIYIRQLLLGPDVIHFSLRCQSSVESTEIKVVAVCFPWM
jgi:hypothetical protein